MYKNIVYLTKNKINGKIYVGVHRTNPEYFDGYIGCGVTHKDKKNCTKIGFPAAVRKYGYENFERKTLFEYPDTEEGRILAFKKEEEIVNEKFVKSPKTYNLVKGGKFTVYEHNKKEIAQYTLEGKFIRTWSSIKEAEDALFYTSISKALTGHSKYAGNFLWRYFNGDTSDIESVTPKEKSVYQFDLSGNLIKCWRTAGEASLQFENPNAARVNINNVCTNKTNSAYGYYWSYKKIFNYKDTKLKAVAKYDDAGNFILAYDSIKEAAEDNNIKSKGNIITAILGKNKRCKGFRWRYYYGSNHNIESL